MKPLLTRDGGWAEQAFFSAYGWSRKYGIISWWYFIYASLRYVFLGLVGLFYLTGLKDTIALSAGGIFYMLHYDMIPKAHKERKWLPTFGAVLGFIMGFAIVRTIGGQ